MNRVPLALVDCFPWFMPFYCLALVFWCLLVALECQFLLACFGDSYMLTGIIVLLSSCYNHLIAIELLHSTKCNWNWSCLCCKIILSSCCNHLVMVSHLAIANSIYLQWLLQLASSIVCCPSSCCCCCWWCFCFCCTTNVQWKTSFYHRTISDPPQLSWLI